MTRGVSWFLVAPLVLVGLLSGCRFGFEAREPWRAEAEEQCIAEKGVVPSAFIEPARAVDGPGVCGMEHPFRVTALADGNVIVEPRATLACPVIRETEAWLADVVQPAAYAWFGQPVGVVRQMSAYSCRGMNGDPTAKISEHAFGNALDVGAFRLADGRWITVKDGWRGTPEEKGFLLQVQAGACERFTTVLAPGSNIFHYDHIHVDLMRHAAGRTICKPAPRRIPAPAMAVAPPPYPGALPVKAVPPPDEPPAPARLPAPAAPPSAAAPAPQGLPPGWNVGPESLRPPAPMSYAGSYAGSSAGEKGGHEKLAGPFTTGSIAQRKYYSAPLPQASTLPLPEARAGED